MTIQEKLAAAEARIKDLETEVASSQDAVQTAVEANVDRLAELELAIEDRDNRLAEAFKASEVLANEVETLQSEVEALKAEAKSAEARALEIAASQGIPEAEVEVNAGTVAPQTREEIVAAFNAMKPGPDRSAFYQKNRNAIQGI